MRDNKWVQLFIGLLAFLVLGWFAFEYLFDGRFVTEPLWRTGLVILAAAMGVLSLVTGIKRYRNLSGSKFGG